MRNLIAGVRAKFLYTAYIVKGQLKLQKTKVRPALAEGDGKVILIEGQASIPKCKEELNTTVAHRSNSHVSF
jgi:hypothetical protein